MTTPLGVPPAANFHLWKPCNERCSYCFATFDDEPVLKAIKGGIREAEALRIIEAIRAWGVEKLTFVGGEPTLCPHLPALLRHAHSLGFVTMLVTNGKRLDIVLDEAPNCLNWVGLSVDSASEATQRLLGRGRGCYVADSLRHFERLHLAGIRTKLNTVVTSANWREDMSDFLLQARPARWKIFQALRVEGQNDARIEPLLITREQFEEFVDRHRGLERHGIVLAAESNDDMTGSYAMIDPAGRFFDNSAGRHTYSRPILEVGVTAAFNDVTFNRARFAGRGGLYAWSGSVMTPLTVSVPK